jgi:hypothetical protein
MVLSQYIDMIGGVLLCIGPIIAIVYGLVWFCVAD